MFDDVFYVWALIPNKIESYKCLKLQVTKVTKVVECYML
jgi:hypothetical protein